MSWSKLEYVDFDYIAEAPRCRKCDEVEQRMDDAGEFLKEVVEQLYGKKHLEPTLLEYALDNLCHYLGVKMVPGDLVIEEKPSHMQYAMTLSV